MALPIALLLVRPDPIADGFAPDGERLVVGAALPVPEGVNYGEAVPTRFFGYITYGYVLALGSHTVGIQQLVKLVEDRTDESTAQFAITALAATSVVARLIGGRLVTSVSMTRFTVAVAALQAVALVGIGLFQQTVLLFISIVVFGATIANLLMVQPLLIAERFGVLDYAKIYGRSQAITIAGVAGGPLFIGALFDLFGSYEVPYVAAAILCAIGAGILALAGPTNAEDQARRDSVVSPA